MGLHHPNREQAQQQPREFEFGHNNPIHNPEAIRYYQEDLTHLLTNPIFTPQLLVNRANDPSTNTPLHEIDFHRNGDGFGDVCIMHSLRSQGVDFRQHENPDVRRRIDQTQDSYLERVDQLFVQPGIRTELSRRVRDVVSDKSEDKYLELLGVLEGYRPVDPRNSWLLAKDILLGHYADGHYDREDNRGKTKRVPYEERELHRLATLYARTSREDGRPTYVEIGVKTGYLDVGTAKGRLADSVFIECVGKGRQKEVERAGSLYAPVYENLGRNPPRFVYKNQPTKAGESLIVATAVAAQASEAARKGADRAGEVASAIADKAPDAKAAGRTLGVGFLATTIGFSAIGNSPRAEAASVYHGAAVTLSAPANFGTQSISLGSSVFEAGSQSKTERIVYGPKSEAAITAMIKAGERKGDGVAVRSAEALRFYMKQGLPSHQAVAPPGSYFVESDETFDPKIKQRGRGPGRGLAQWEKGGRWDVLLKFADDRGINPTDLDTQLEFSWYEFEHEEHNALRKLRGAGSVREAAEAFGRYYERPARLSDTLERRINYAEKLHRRFLDYYGDAPSGDAPSPTPTPRRSAAPSKPDRPIRAAQPPETLLSLGDALFTEPLPDPEQPRSDTTPGELTSLGGLFGGDIEAPEPTPPTPAPRTTPTPSSPRPPAPAPRLELNPPATQQPKPTPSPSTAGIVPPDVAPPMVPDLDVSKEDASAPIPDTPPEVSPPDPDSLDSAVTPPVVDVPEPEFGSIGSIPTPGAPGANAPRRSDPSNRERPQKDLSTQEKARVECSRLGIKFTGQAEGWSKGEKSTIFLCQIPEKYWEGSKQRDVNITIAEPIIKIMEEMHIRGYDIRLSSDYRSMSEQEAARVRNGCGGPQNPSSACTVDPVARPGWSSHQMGTAVDLVYEGQLIRERGTPVQRNLIEVVRANGMTDIAEEAWHIQE